MPKANTSLSEAREQFLASRRGRLSRSTLAADEVVTQRFVRAIGDIQVRNVTAEHVERFLLGNLGDHTGHDGIRRGSVNGATFNNYRARVKAFSVYLSARGLTREDLMALTPPMKKERTRRLQPTPVMLWQMLDSASNPRDRAILALAANTGLRANEITALKIGDVDLDTLTLNVRISKTREVDAMPITDDLADELRTWLDWYRCNQVQDLNRIAQSTDYLFPARRGPRYAWVTEEDGTKVQIHTEATYDPLRPVLKVHGIAQQALAALGLPTVGEGIHTIRRGVARALFDALVAEDGYDGALRVTSAFLHHSNMSTTETYLGLSSETRKRDLHLRGRSLLGPKPGSADASVLSMAADG